MAIDVLDVNPELSLSDEAAEAALESTLESIGSAIARFGREDFRPIERH